MSLPAPVTVAAPTAHPARRPRTAGWVGIAFGLLTVALCVVGVWLAWRIFVGTVAGQRVDQAVYAGAHYGRNRLWQLAEPVLQVVSVPYVAIVLAAAVTIALVRRRWALALVAGLVVAGANLTTQVLKNLVFDRPDLGATPVFSNALPSGHTTAAASVSAALILVVPPRIRPWAAVLGAVYTSATGISTLVGGWHRPSDVVAAVLVVLAWSAGACVITALTPSRGLDGDPGTATGQLALAAGAQTVGAGRRRGLVGFGLGGGLLVLMALGAGLLAAWSMSVSWTTPGDLDSRSELLIAYAGGAFGVIAMTCLAFATLLVVRQAAGRAV